jgi:sulfite exporter TauE/SafE
MNLLSGLFNFIPHVIIMIAVILYVQKKSTPEGIMMLVGSIIGTLVSLFYTLIFPNLVRDDGYDTYQKYLGTIGVVSTLGYLSFAIGLLLVMQKIASDKKQ